MVRYKTWTGNELKSRETLENYCSNNLEAKHKDIRGGSGLSHTGSGKDITQFP